MMEGFCLDVMSSCRGDIARFVDAPVQVEDPVP